MRPSGLVKPLSVPFPAQMAYSRDAGAIDMEGCWSWDHSKQRGLARSAGAHDGEDLAGGDRHVGSPQGVGLAERLADIAGLDQRGTSLAARRLEIGAHAARTASASSLSLAEVVSIQRRSASRWNRP